MSKNPSNSTAAHWPSTTSSACQAVSTTKPTATAHSSHPTLLSVSCKPCHSTKTPPTTTRNYMLMDTRLRITADFSHWMVGCERLLDIGESDIAMMESIIPHVSCFTCEVGFVVH